MLSTSFLGEPASQGQNAQNAGVLTGGEAAVRIRAARALKAGMVGILLLGAVSACDGAPPRTPVSATQTQSVPTSDTDVSMLDSGSTLGAASASAAEAPPEDASADAWRIGEVPTLVIGAASTEERGHIFTGIVSAVRLSSGAIAVADRGAKEIKVFSASGEHMATMGRGGSGPGEFSAIDFLGVTVGDTIIVSDQSTGRVSYFTPTGTLIRTATPWRPVRIVGRFDDGTMLVRRSGVRMVDPPSGVRTSTFDALRMGVEGDSIAWITAYPALLISPPVWTVVFSPRSTPTVSGSYQYHGFGDRYEIHVLDRHGDTLRTITRGVVPRRVTEQDSERWRKQFIANGRPDEAEFLGQTFDTQMVVAEFHPVFSQLLVDGVGLLWVRNYAIEDGLPFDNPAAVGGKRSWSIFNQSGEYVGECQTPPGLRVTEIGRDFVLGVWESAEGAQVVHQYRLLRPD